MCLTASAALRSTKEDAPGAGAASSARAPTPLANAIAAWVKTRRDHLATIILSRKELHPSKICGRNPNRSFFDNF
jgi:hypothetical protein